MTKPIEGSEGRRIVANKNRRLQVAETRSKRFDKGMREAFITHFYGTCNVAASARAAGVAPSTVYRRRDGDPAFAAEWRRALAAGYAALETEAVREAQAALKRRPDRRVGAAPPRIARMDPHTALTLLREHKRSLGDGIARGGWARAGRAPVAASNADVRAALIRRLKSFGIRVAAERCEEERGEEDRGWEGRGEEDRGEEDKGGAA